MTFHVKALPRAEDDIRSITTFIYERSPKGAASWLKAYEDAITHLKQFAEGCPVAIENDELEIDARQKRFKTRRGNRYRLVFTIVRDEVRILRVLGPGRRPLRADEIE